MNSFTTFSSQFLPMLSTNTSEKAANKQSFNYILRSLVAGGVAGCVAKTATAPLDRVKILFQGGSTDFRHFSGSVSGTFRAVGHILETNGARGLWKGHSATLFRVFPYAALNFMCYEQYKQLFLPQGKGGKEHPFARILAGSCAGCTSVFFTYPLDYVRTRMAYQHKVDRYRGVWHAIVSTVEESGLRGLYRGFGATAMGIIPYAGMSFYSYETLKRYSHTHLKRFALKEDGTFRVPWKLACGGLAGAFAQTAAYPLDLIRRRQQLAGFATHVPVYRHAGDAFVSILRTEGIRGLYVGLSINYIKVAPATSISFLSYEFMKKRLNIAGSGTDV